MRNQFTILIIDDEQSLLESVSAFMEDSGFQTLTASDGDSGLALFQEKRPDIVLLDLRMPGRQGLEIMRIMRETISDVPIIVVSGTGVIQDVVEAMRQGASDFFIKPVLDLSLLEHSVSRALEHAALKKEHGRYQQRLEEDISTRTRQLMEANAKLQEEIRRRDTAEKAMAASLQEKEILLREVHHRVKNNLQIISSLLSLQAENTSEPMARDAFLESRQRVASMALVHEKLYQANDFAQVDMGQFARELIGQHTCTSDRCGIVSVTADDESFPLSINQAIPCGLMLNELTSNIMHHAFPGRRSGTMRVYMSRQDRRVELVVEDDGVGLPESFSLQSPETLGFRLIHALTYQLRGDVSFESKPGKGMRCSIRFPMSTSAGEDSADLNISAFLPLEAEPN
ncbi:sensor histidine kinase [Oceanidesulfovibrio marinus]|uniref:histidine kinase n=1 Tax=Oceanidesulfovibrio marinus TaxID=370038 RepID=A0A6P1ZHX1_9BACT|nr:histidine kinase dimerization/phosphoacceptor domain -containing protein [Oceanidesulfovibrio marinus]QJT10697.1 response regulator [Oceanidesulfovibrio marinus]TVM34076.1 histidine kinase [Oceanidesulfovibrio marinus]